MRKGLLRLRRGLIFQLEVDGAHLTAPVLFHVVGDPLVLAQGLQAGAFDGTDVDECIAFAAVGLDEAEAFGFVEKFYGADWHFNIPSVAETERRIPGAKSCEIEGKRSRKAPKTVNLRLVAALI